MLDRSFKLLAVACVVMLLQACGTAHIKPGAVAEDLSLYKNAYIGSVDLSSKEADAEVDATNKKMKSYATMRLAETIQSNAFTLVSSNTDLQNSLLFDLDIDIVYGNRAARYFIGFGAGKGTMRSVLTVKDKTTGKVVYSATGASDLSVGAFGGSMESVIKNGIDKLLQGFPGGSAG